LRGRTAGSDNEGVITNLTHPTTPSEPLVATKLDFGRMFTPNFFVAEYRNGQWRNPRIQRVEPFSLHPASLVFHYCQTVFEGLKAFRQDNGRIVLFRPEMNARRFQRSAERLRIPPIEEAFFLEAVHALVENERHFVPSAPGCLYVRPVVMGVDPALGVKSAGEFIFFVLTLPSGPYFKDAGEGPGAIQVLVSKSVVRSAPGMMGSVKAGANYAGTLKVTEEAKAIGCAQVLFLDARDHEYVEEMGGMNILFVQNGRLRTPPLTDTILNGVTRESLLVIARDLGIETSEDPIRIDEVSAGLESGAISEVMACGTAAVVIGIRSLRFENGSSVSVSGGCPGPVTSKLYDGLVAIQYGRAADRHGWVREVCVAEAPAAQSHSVGR
jgi:branched-chain amino acid aminotransferase